MRQVSYQLREPELPVLVREPGREQQVQERELQAQERELQAQQLRELLSQVEHTTFCDEKILEIVREEFAAVDAGDRSAAEAAALVQSRVSLYVSEQKS